MDQETERLINQISELFPQKHFGKFTRNHPEGGSTAGIVMRCLLDSDSTVTPGDLSRELGVTGPRITVILNELEKRGHILRETSPTDRRSVVVTLTEAGRKRVEEYNAHRRDCVARLVERIGPEDARVLARVLKTIREMEEEESSAE